MKFKTQTIKEALVNYDKAQVSVFCSYILALSTEKKQGEIKNKWMAFVTDEQLVGLYEKVAIDGLFIDGETITLQFKAKLMVSYNFQAYKNKLLMVYPESRFDMQLVHNGDEFETWKEDGRVHYTHKITDPFAVDSEIKGAYCIIKNKRGEFFEAINVQDIEKMRNIAKTDSIWAAWYGEMVMKSVIKRSCKRHFKDQVTNMEELDNENYELELVGLEHEFKDLINSCNSEKDLQLCYDTYKNKVSDRKAFMKALSDRKEEVMLDINQEIY